MNEKIANILKGKIQNLAFVDKIAGLVRPVKIEILDKENKRILKTYPIATDISSEQCIEGKYKDLIPDSKYKSIIYFEDNGSQITYRDHRWVGFNSRLTLVGWLNLSKLMNCTHFTGSTEVILSIISSLPEVPFSDDIFREIRITAISEVIKTSAIFGKYTYNEIITQYLLYPFDYFALNLSIDYKINLSCVEQFNVETCNNCL